MKYFTFLLACTILFSCNTDIAFENAVLYTGTIQFISKKDGVITGESNFDIRVKLSDNAFFRVDEAGNKTCFGELEISDDKVKFSSSECSCHCDCDPFIDCVGDEILGEHDIVFESDERLELEAYQDLSDLIYPYLYDEWIKKIVLEKE